MKITVTDLCYAHCTGMLTRTQKWGVKKAKCCPKQAADVLKKSMTIVFTPGNCCHFQFGSSRSSLPIHVPFIFHLSHVSHCPDFQVTSPCVILIYQAIYTDMTPNGLYCSITPLMGWKTHRWLWHKWHMNCLLGERKIPDNKPHFMRLLFLDLFIPPSSQLYDGAGAQWGGDAASGFVSDYCYVML